MRYPLLRRGSGSEPEAWVQTMWRPAAPASRSCCCSATPAVQAVVPPSETRKVGVELLLCGHHYRICRQGLIDTGATMFDLAGFPLTPATEPAGAAGSR